MSIYNEYENLVNLTTDLIHTLSEQSSFEKIYQSKSFFKKQFDMDLNVQRTNYKTKIEELNTNIQRLKKRLAIAIQNHFFYENTDSKISDLIKENEKMLEKANFEIRIIEGSYIGITKRFDIFSGSINNKYEIIILPDNDKKNITNQFFDDEFYIDFEGFILPNGYAEFKGRNLSDVSMMGLSTMNSGRYYFKPGHFSIQINSDKKWIINADLKNKLLWRYELKGFKILISNINKEQFYENAKILNCYFELFKKDFSLVYESFT